MQYFEETRTFLKRKKDRKIVACCTQIEQLKNECGNSGRGLVSVRVKYNLKLLEKISRFK